MLRQSQQTEVKTKLSGTLRNWLPILHAPLSDLGEAMTPFVESNPLIEIKSGFEEDFEKHLPKKIFTSSVTNSRTEAIEALSIQQRSLYDVLDEQLEAPLFPTPASARIAAFVASNLDENGYFEGDVAAFCAREGIDEAQFWKVHARFAHVEPVGIGARNLKESFLFQLDASDIDPEAYALARVMIVNLEAIHTYANQSRFAEAMRVIGRFKNPPNIDFLEASPEVVPDLIVYRNDDGGIEIRLNDAYYPAVEINHDYGIDHDYVREKLKEAKGLVDALEMRRATIYKVGLMIIEYQYDYFQGGAIMPLTLKTLADEFGHNPSTISRAIANKYIACDRGMIPMKDFFVAAIDEEVSNAAIKEYVSELVKKEPRHKPLSDMKLLELVQKKFGVTMVRRTIAKYRMQLGIEGSSERKKNYKLERG